MTEKNLQKEFVNQKELEEIKKSKMLYSVIIENSSDAILKIQNGMIVFANSAAIVLLGYSYERLLKLRFLDTVAPESLNLLRKRKREIKSGKVLEPLYEISLVRKDKTIVPVEIILNPLR